jgi:nucleoside 2-deoxyribosyltransferase
MSIPLSVFLSCSFDPASKPSVDWVDRKLRAFGLQTHVANMPTSETVVTKVLADIKSRDILAAVITNSDAPWVYNEIGMAYALNKPIIAFFEQGVNKKGLNPYISHYVEFDKNSPDLATDAATHLINSVLQKMSAERKFSESQQHQIKTITQTEFQGSLRHELSRSRFVDVQLYTAESLMHWDVHQALQEDKKLKLRLLIRNPEADQRKGPMAVAVCNFLAQLKHNGVEVRYYPEPPLLRFVIFDRTKGYVGLYKWNPDTHFEYHGAENNALIDVNQDSAFGRLWLEIYKSRFEHDWQRATTSL